MVPGAVSGWDIVLRVDGTYSNETDARAVAEFVRARIADLTDVRKDGWRAWHWPARLPRKNRTPARAIADALRPIEEAAAKERQREGGRRGGQGGAKLAHPSKAPKAAGKSRAKVAAAVGMSAATLEKAT